MTKPAFFKYTNSIVTKGATEIARNWFFDVVADDEEESLGCTTSSADGEDLIALVYRDEALVMGNEFETITHLDDDGEEYEEDVITGWTWSTYLLDTDSDGEPFWDYFSTDGSDNVDDAKDIINKWWERVKGGE